MLIVKIHGGLANQMFQYALYKSIMKKGNKVYCDSTTFVPSWGFDDLNLEDIFPNLQVKEADITSIKKLSLSESFIDKVKRKIGLSKSSHFYETAYTFNNSIFDLKSNTYLDGYWQTEKYFKHIAENIRSDFTFSDFSDKKNIDLLLKLKQQESVSIHVRKGADYKKSIVSGTCEIDYYNGAIDIIKKKVKNPKFFVFTDNKSWVKENLDHLEFTLIDWNPVSGPSNYLDMQLMSKCKHNIIANSSYSWWGAWLNTNFKKVVIGPKLWFSKNTINYDSSDILPKEWISI